MTQNEERLFRAVRERLKSDILAEEFRGRPDNPFYGHCFHASVALYKLLGGKDGGYAAWRAIDCTGVPHYWITSSSGEIIDPTEEQYTDFGRKPPHDSEKRKRTGFRPTNAARNIVQAIKENEAEANPSD